MILPFNAPIYFYRKPIDFRCGIDGLCLLISNKLKNNPCSGNIFIFRNKGNDRLKILYYENSGFWLLYRRLEQGKLKYPEIQDITMNITAQQLQWLLSGLEILDHKTVSYSKFY